MSVNMLMTNLDFGDTNLQGLYSNIQGNILKSHGRDHARHIFLRLKGDATANRALVADMHAEARRAGEARAERRRWRPTRGAWRTSRRRTARAAA